ncbi:MAG: type VI secretion system tip protein VgrG [Desulfovibrio sp.]|jgi:type VI secretion system secreted protein VgrG|nr:type VI secretion system tip protein VgrG [Desulfovibrio sp.]
MPNNDLWQFSCAALGADQCRVLAVSGEDTVSEGYVFDILLLALDVRTSQAEEKQEALMTAASLTLTARRTSARKTEIPWTGMAREVRHCFTNSAGTLYAVRLNPHSSKLRFSTHSRIFRNLALPGLLDKLLVTEGLASGSDFADAMREQYPARPFTCQYNEDAFAFMSRHLERMGAYTYIEQTPGGDRLVLADAKSEAATLPVQDVLDHGEKNAGEAVFAFGRALRAGPNCVRLRDYCTEQPGLSQADASADAPKLWGKSEQHIFGAVNCFGELDCFTRVFTAETANANAQTLADARLRGLITQAGQYRGQSHIPWLRAGYAFTLDGRKHQLVRVKHRCLQAGDGLGQEMVKEAKELGLIDPDLEDGYKNSFTSLPLDLGPYAPEAVTPTPRIHGVVSALVDAEENGEYAELDAEGRYKVKLPFAEDVISADADTQQDGNNSIPLRMMQQHVGADSGIHFPLQKGVEVLVAFIDGDPDRPVIMGALPNPEHKSVVVDSSRQNNVIRSPGGNSITMTDTKGSREIRVESPDKQSFISIFTP